MLTVRPYAIHVPQSDLDDLRRRLRATRWAPDFANENWDYGVERGWLQPMAAYWRDEFDWRKQEAAINAHPQFLAQIEGIPIHFLHVRGKGPNPVPLVLTHGWPWTFWDYRHLIGPLTDPAAHGADPALSFDLVIPSLPGFAFSTPLTVPGIDLRAIARLWVQLMTEGLGYRRFGVAGGDWGAMLSAQVGHEYEDHIVGCYLTMCCYPGMDFGRLQADSFAPDERWMLERLADAKSLILSHVTVHRLDPQTLAYALVDSPVGTAAWLWERRRAWSDCDGDLLSIHDRDDLCTLASMYWLPPAIGSSMRLYAAQFRHQVSVPKVHDRNPVIAAPTAYAVFPKDLSFMPRAMAASATNLQQWTVMPKGGHFGPAEQPQRVVADLRRFFSLPACRARVS
jgi:pimeloyl-ACP methyl ester carboxylesterase